MAGVSKVNPASTVGNVNLQGTSLKFITVAYIGSTGASDVKAETGPSGALTAVINTIQNYGTIAYIGSVFSVANDGYIGSATKQSFAVEFPGGGNPELTASTATGLRDAIRALNLVGAVDLSASTVTAKDLEL